MVEKMQLIIRLQALKKDYDTCRMSKKNYAQLLQQREDIHDEIVRLKEEAEIALLKHKQMSQQMDELAGLRQKLREIDHEIDEIGEHQEEKLAALKKELVETIQMAFPETAAPYHQLCQKLDAYRSEEVCCKNLLECLQPFHAALNEGAAAKQSRGFLSILFGRNPKVILARAIRKASIEAERVYKQVEEHRIREFLSAFLEEANRPWNGSLYKERFFELHQEFDRLMKEVKESNTRAKQGTVNTEKEIEFWIEQHCNG
jgi:signal transduction histidine kinase